MDTGPLADFSLAAVPPGTRRRLALVAGTGSGGPATLPVVVAKGAAPGPTLLAVAGVHGDEYEGMEAIRGVFGRLDPGEMRGAFVGVIVANPAAYEARTRATPAYIDGLNLARVFPGDPAGSPSLALAHALLAFVLRLVTADDLVLDFHSGSADIPFAPLIGFRAGNGPGTERAEEAARRFGFPRLWRIPDAPGPLNAETARRGIPTLGTETTGRAGCEPDDVAGFARGLANLLAHLGVCPGWPVATRHDGPARDTVEVLAPAAGFLRPAARLHDEVAAGGTLGTIVDLFGDPVAEVVAPVGGTLWAARSMPAVRTGELCAMIAVR